MSGFGFGGGGFGQNNNQQQSAFGGFGANNTTANTGFGSTGTSGFGGTTTNSTGSIFGGGTTTGFGGGFGANNSGGAFGAAKPSGFGTSTTSSGGGLFGSSNTATAGTSGFGGFGQTPAASTSGFGGGNTGSSLFGGNKTTGFGGTTSTPAFGGGASTGGFGSTTGGAFGAPASTALSGGAGECQGTGSVAFQAYVEKEPNSTSNQQNSFQSISFQAPYQKFSPEELRLADYTQGRRYGNQSGQPGAFGATNFTSFGSNSQTPASGFGGATSTTGSNMFGGGSGFGAPQQQTSGFGGAATATGGGLFGAAKPATGLFGAQQPAAQPAGGLFGGGGFGGGAASGGFGSSNTSGTTSTLFGANSAANKPSGGFSFGQAAPASTGAGFGTAPAASGFGTGGLFGGANNAQQPAATNPFGGQQQQQPATTSTFGNFGAAAQQPATSNLFGNAQQQKPATGLFSQAAAAPTGGLFGATQPAATNNPFGTATNNQQGGGGLFGAPKPATPAATSLFSGNTQTNAGSGGLFGNSFGGSQTQTQPQQTGGLFGNLGNTSQQKPGGLFGTQSQQQTGGGLFGASLGTQQQGGGLFGGSANNNQQQQQQQQPQNSLFGGGGSLFGATAQQSQQQTPQSLTASINDPAAFGNASLFASLIATENKNPGPLATPLSGSQKKKTAALPIYKLNPASSSRFSTPAKRGFGFSYSTYGSPASASSTASTPGGNLNNSLLGGSLSRGLSKSMSTSSLRRNFNTEDSILAPGAFSASPNARQFGSTGSIKKLVINRGLRGDLFSPPPQQNQQAPAATSSNSGILKKRVSFDASSLSGTANGLLSNGTSSPLKQVHTNSTPTSQELGLLRPSTTNGGKENGSASSPEMEQVKNNELAIVHEEETTAASHSKSSSQPVGIKDQEPGNYWMKPTLAEIESMSNTQRKAVVGLTVGREGIGQVTFKEAVDLTKVDVRDICDGIVILAVRSCTVYPNTAKKPPRGQGLNVPSRISLMNSWPRSSRVVKSGSRMKKHVSQLQKVDNTTFEGYDEKTGVWTFSVEHFTTYGLDYDENETDVEEPSEFGQSTLSAPPDSPTPNGRTPQARNFDDSFASTSQVTESDPDDTFDFRKKKTLPGAFDDRVSYADDEEMGEEFDEQLESFLDERSVGSQSEDGVDEPMEHDQALDWGSANIEDDEMAGSFPQVGNTAEQEYNSQEDEDVIDVNEAPGGYAMARLTALKEGTPLKRKFTAGNDWTNTLTTTVSPQKQDRALLKSFIDVHGNHSRPHVDDDSNAVHIARTVSDGRGFATSIDLMNSLFNQAGSPTKKSAKILAQPKGFEWPYSKKPKTTDSESKMSDTDRAFHDSLKPSWGPDGTLVYAGLSNPKLFGRSSRRGRERDGLLTTQKGAVVSERRNVQFAKFSNETSAIALKRHIEMTVIEDHEGIPFATLTNLRLSDFVSDLASADPAASHEKLVWQLASVLWDKMDVPKELSKTPNIEDRLRKKGLSIFWEKLVDVSSSNSIALARSGEEKAIASLSGHRVADACANLINGKNFHLATLVALIGGRESMRKDMREQLREWSTTKCLSEFSQPIRAIYELLAGNVCVCDGFKGSLEDRIDSFIISTRFGLDWRQAFGLRLWYGTRSTAEIEEAVLSFANDLNDLRELAIPRPWYVEQKIPTLWEDEELESREDLLWGLLKLYTFSDTDLEAVIRPENSQLSPLDARLSWQLSRTLSCVANVNYIADAEEKADQLTLSLASQLNSEGSWIEAAFVLIHLSSRTSRAKALQDHLAHHASLIGTEDSSTFTRLNRDFKIPAPWIWEAKALFMRSVKKDPRREVDCLLKAGLFEEAHRTFAKEVAPKAVIERNYDVLRLLLNGFNGKENAIPEWHLGGEVYSDFLKLLDSEKKGSPVDNLILQRLLASLPAMIQASRNPVFMETVAVETISSEVAQAVMPMRETSDKHDLHKILKLPLTEDEYLKHTVELSLGYYKEVMASGR